MQRRRFIQISTAVSATSMLQSARADFSKQGLQDAALLLNPYIHPEERLARRIYDNSKAPGVVWHTAMDHDPVGNRRWSSTVCFVEAVSDSEKLLYFPGFLVRNDGIPTATPGFYLYFGLTFVWLALPRRNSKKPGVMQERYAFETDAADHAKTGIIGGTYSIDFREVKLIQGSSVHQPTHTVKGTNERDVTPTLEHLVKPAVYSAQAVTSSPSETLFFDMQPRPLRFSLELPPVIVQGVEIPLPTCHFEPFNVSTNKWVEP